MSVDDLVLFCQRGLDRLIRRLRRGAAPARTHRRLLIVQIDGLSHAALQHGLAAGRMPFLKRMLERRGYRLEPMSVGMPTSTPAFQMAAMYGVRPNIPGFHYYDRERGGDIHFPRRGHAAWVEERQAVGRLGILQGGSTYGCVFTGGAENNFYSFTSLTRPSGRGLLSALSPFVVLAWVALKGTAYTVVELTRALFGFLANPTDARQSWRWLAIKIGMSVWVRGLFTLAVSRDLYEGSPVVYVNYLDYDVAAHAFGPRSRRALRSLRYVDHAIHQLWRVLRRVPEHRYDIYILADHGQAHVVPYRDLTKGQRLERWIIEQLPQVPRSEPAAEVRVGLARGIRSCGRDTRAVFQRFVNYMDEDFLRRRDPEAYQRDGFRAIAAGPNAFFYALDAPAPLDAHALEHRFPGFAEEVSRSPGVGFVLARGTDGPVCFWRGKRMQLRESDPGPFAGRPDAALVVRGITDLMAMPSAGDLVIYGIDAAEGHVSFIPEVGAHAGPSPEEMQTFIVRPGHVSLPSPITHPLQLYDHFIRYQSEGQAPDA
jgi:type I phosphodiesterase/nucleotide pyrophosphatase